MSSTIQWLLVFGLLVRGSIQQSASPAQPAANQAPANQWVQGGMAPNFVNPAFKEGDAAPLDDQIDPLNEQQPDQDIVIAEPLMPAPAPVPAPGPQAVDAIQLLKAFDSMAHSLNPSTTTQQPSTSPQDQRAKLIQQAEQNIGEPMVCIPESKLRKLMKQAKEVDAAHAIMMAQFAAHIQ